MAMVISFLGLLMLLGNQLRVLFKGVGVKRGRAAAREPRSSDRLINTAIYFFIDENIPLHSGLGFVSSVKLF